MESVAENTVDAVVAPALWALAAGAAGALGYRAVNTMDAMVGHRSHRYLAYGWASARADDLAGWVPARVTAALVAAVRPAGAGAVWRAVRRDAPAHPSPNAGVAEAAFAAALGLRLGGFNRYGERVELRPPLGSGRPPEPADIARAVRLSGDVALALAGALTVVGRPVGVQKPSARRFSHTRWPEDGDDPGRRARRRRTPAGRRPRRHARRSARPVGQHEPRRPRPGTRRGPPPRRPGPLPRPGPRHRMRWPRRWPCRPARLLLTNGGAEAIALVAAELGPGWVDEPDFSLYRRHLPAIDPDGPRWRSNPHNPTGRLAPSRRDG